ncbi:class I SAM-dependent methyltransferase [Massilia niastensis]|uniref:class I SAM-dependent methyltransferase n=1 Tax=Massilia niastensis TaxID=544911 RepID=UPI000381B70D|nr:methyltransferase domain-containing protein [Massilia niastensis]
MEQIVSNYRVVGTLQPSATRPMGDSVSPKAMIAQVLADNSRPVSVLDIGFGVGTLGQFIKTHPDLRHWSVDGVDGWGPNCHNRDLLDQNIYRNVWHGLAQELPMEQIKSYDIICLLDVIEHLPRELARTLVKDLLESLADDALLFISTPLWFYPQDALQDGDLEEHLIGVPASSMLAMQPRMYCINHPLVGGFIYDKRSLAYADFFQPSTDRNFSYAMGMEIVRAVRMEHAPGVIYKY